MASLINTLDQQQQQQQHIQQHQNTQQETPRQLGEKGHVEYGWSTQWRERILQLSFQLTRTDSNTVESLSQKVKELLFSLRQDVISLTITPAVFQEAMIVLYKMIGHTRDIVDGKGEYTLTYMLITTWYELYPELSKFALQKMVEFVSQQPQHQQQQQQEQHQTNHQYGSWKDIKYFCNYCKEVKGLPQNHPLIEYACKLLNDQIRQDYHNMVKPNPSISLAAKWSPREKSKFGWLFNKLATSYFEEYMTSATTQQQQTNAQLKCKTHYRKVVVAINKHLDTVQIKQCSNDWAAIDHSKTTSITVTKQKQAFLNVQKNGQVRTDLPDRIRCANNFKERIQQALKGECTMKGKRTGLSQFTVQANDLIRRKNIDRHYQDETHVDDYQIEIDLLNVQWQDNSSTNQSLGQMLAMIDFSGSMDGSPLNTAIALGCRIAEKSVLGKRIMSFSSNPTWHNLEDCDTFVDMVERLYQDGEVGYSTNFYKALDKILDAIIEKKLRPEEVSSLVLTILSDMQIDVAEKHDSENELTMSTVYDMMATKYAEAGLRLWGQPFTPPHILFWNLRSTDGFPSLSSQPNVSMLSGQSSNLLNLFCEQGIDALSTCTPWSMMVASLNKPRYQCLEDRLKQEIY